LKYPAISVHSESRVRGSCSARTISVREFCYPRIRKLVSSDHRNSLGSGENEDAIALFPCIA